MQGLDLSGLLIIDAHTHLGADAPGRPAARCMIDLMDELGIRQCLNSSLVALYSDCRAGNDMVHDAMRAFPGRIAGLCVINPHYPEEIVPEIEKRVAQGFVGVKIEPFLDKVHAADESYHLAYECAHRHHLIVKAHTYNDGHPENTVNHPALFDAIAEKYQHARFIIAHAGGAPAVDKE